MKLKLQNQQRNGTFVMEGEYTIRYMQLSKANENKNAAHVRKCDGTTFRLLKYDAVHLPFYFNPCKEFESHTQPKTFSDKKKLQKNLFTLKRNEIQR